MSVTALRTVWGWMLCWRLCSCWSLRRRWVSVMARRMEFVISSAYITTWPSTLRATLPMVWIKEVSLRRKPSLSASSIATRETSGRSKPSRSRFIPTSTSNTPSLRSRRISIRSKVSTSLWR